MDPRDTRIPLKGGRECDALDRLWKRWYHWKPGVRREIKRGYWRRFRRLVRERLKGTEHG